MKHTDSVSRREFIQTSGKTTAAVVAGTLAAPSIPRGAEPSAEPVRIAQIGLGTRGGNLIGAATHARPARSSESATSTNRT